MKKIMGLVLLIVVVAGATSPVWLSCDIKSDLCSRWCGIKHYDSTLNAAACRAECVGDKLNCLAKEGRVVTR
ncbi:MAG: hypothetical protein OEZ16_08720 [Chromatiales bacterium]|nr:hypothetical protein [Chromatiales bacterium]